MRLCLSDFKLWIRLWSLCLRAPSNSVLPSTYTLCHGSAWRGIWFSAASHSALPSLHDPAMLPEAQCSKLDPLLGVCILSPGHALQCLILLYYLDLCLWKRHALIILSRSALFPLTLPPLLVGHFAFPCLLLVCFHSWHVKPMRVERPCLPCYCHTVESGSVF